MGWMNKFTLLRAVFMRISGKDYEIEIQDRYLVYLIKRIHVSLLHQKLHQRRLFCSPYASGVIPA